VLALAESESTSRPGASVLELYAGAGNFTVLLARAFTRVLAVESNAAACEAARANLASRGLTAKVTCADADELPIPPRTDVVVLDPPRRGARKVCEALAASSARAIVYVSCDAPTLGRDLASLEPRFDLVALESFAMFPGTSHSETIAHLRRKALR
jgi:23S rRNA (uracil1939-C5)-methyltransferase